jgi:hypothetical protein
MKPASGTLNTFLNSNTKFEIADLYTFTLLDGTVIRWTDYDQDIVVRRQHVLLSAPTIKRGRVAPGGRDRGLDVLRSRSASATAPTLRS